MAKRTLDTTLHQFEKFFNSYKANKKSSEDTLKFYDDLISKPDMVSICSDLALVLFEDYPEFQEVKLSFQTADSMDAPQEGKALPMSYQDREKLLIINPVSIFNFIVYANDIATNLDTYKGKSFEQFRHNSFVAEMSKLPPKSILFILVLQQVAAIQKLTLTEYTENALDLNDDTNFYQTFLWAFKELENRIYKINGLSLRTEYSISWHESSWISEN